MFTVKTVGTYCHCYERKFVICATQQLIPGQSEQHRIYNKIILLQEIGPIAFPLGVASPLEV